MQAIKAACNIAFIYQEQENKKMKLLLTYFRLELKRSLTVLPRLLLGSLLLLFLTGVISLAGTKLLYQDSLKEKVKIAVVMESQDEGLKWMMSMVKSMDSVKSVCEFVEMTEEEAVAKLRDKTIYGAIVVPDDMLSGILDGSNTPARILLPPGSELQNKLFEALTESGVQTLGAAQSGIYAVSNFLIENNAQGLIPKLEEELNMEYLDIVLPRSELFLHRVFSVTGESSIIEYYAASGCVFFMLLWGLSCPVIFKKNRELNKRLIVYGLNSIQLTAIKTVVIFILLLITLTIVGSILLCYTAVSGSSLAIEISGIFPFLISAFLAAIMIVFFYSIASNLISGVLILLTGSSILVFLSGGMLPIAFLPEIVQKIAPFLPTTYMIRLSGMIFTGYYSGWSILTALLFSVLLFLIAVFFLERSVSLQKEEN